MLALAHEWYTQPAFSHSLIEGMPCSMRGVGYHHDRAYINTHTHARLQLFVFDIDETALSNAEEWTTTGYTYTTENTHTQPTQSTHQGCHGGRITRWLRETLASATGAKNAARVSEPAAAAAAGYTLPIALRKGAAYAAGRPALTAVRDLYLWLVENGYSVAFITGRKEAGREETAKNLKEAGACVLVETHRHRYTRARAFNHAHISTHRGTYIRTHPR